VVLLGVRGLRKTPSLDLEFVLHYSAASISVLLEIGGVVRLVQRKRQGTLVSGGEAGGSCAVYAGGLHRGSPNS
jgi:uncharacterized membrane protein (UPF0136 family)